MLSLIVTIIMINPSLFLFFFFSRIKYKFHVIRVASASRLHQLCAAPFSFYPPSPIHQNLLGSLFPQERAIKERRTCAPPGQRLTNPMNLSKTGGKTFSARLAPARSLHDFAFLSFFFFFPKETFIRRFIVETDQPWHLNCINYVCVYKRVIIIRINWKIEGNIGISL